MRNANETQFLEDIEEFWPTPEEIQEELEQMPTATYVDKEVNTTLGPQEKLRIPEVRILFLFKFEAVRNVLVDIVPAEIFRNNKKRLRAKKLLYPSVEYLKENVAYFSDFLEHVK